MKGFMQVGEELIVDDDRLDFERSKRRRGLGNVDCEYRRTRGLS